VTQEQVNQKVDMQRILRSSSRAFPTALLVIALLTLNPSRAKADDRIFRLVLINEDTSDVIVTMQAGDCYEGDMPNDRRQRIAGRKVNQTGIMFTITLARVQGHDCDGKQGRFKLKFDPPDSEGRNIQDFNFDNEGYLALGGGEVANPYAGKLSNKKLGGNYYYNMFVPAFLKAGPTTGHWSFVGSNGANVTYKTELTSSKSNTITEQQKKAMSLAIKTGVKFETPAKTGGSLEVTWTGSTEEVNTIAKTDSEGRSLSETLTVGLTLDQMEARSIHAIWQWVVSTQMNDGTQLDLRTNHITYTKNGLAPTYLPGSEEDIASIKNPK
jgi:hypothetical protein